jgi:hypothetical protein
LPTFISIEKILSLPWYVGELGLLLAIAGFASGIWSIFRLQFGGAAVRLVFSFLLLLVLTHNGNDIVRYINKISDANRLGQQE